MARTGLLAAASATLLLGPAACTAETVGTGVPAPAALSSAVTSAGEVAASAARTPEAAVTGWVTQILKEDYAAACRSSAAGTPDPEKLCASDGKAVKTLGKLHEAWAKPGVDTGAAVETERVEVTGDTATAPDTSIKIGGKSLRELELVGSSGDTSSFRLTLKLTKKDGAWYVSDFELAV
ncbi:hypothetical protein [Amycolatopsis pretoriensis]|uniref:hypothetical protein n=1 Tax=Amycolatopsis pretoriensis TaxID=218821 RepID=UPI001FCA157D|nr:hypothetical protein [Amycolatopsis pretoriensis]